MVSKGTSSHEADCSGHSKAASSDATVLKLIGGVDPTFSTRQHSGRS